MSEGKELGTGFYVTGGTIKPGSERYIVRNSDEELFQAIPAGEFCYVLTTRQIGKSGLVVQTGARLGKLDIGCYLVDLTTVGGDKGSVTAEQWYYGVAYKILRDLKIGVRLEPWWQEHRLMPAVQRFTEFLGDLVLNRSRQRVVIFIDEIDSTIGLPYSNDFFAAIRACYNLRATNEDFERLTFVLLGVATPAQLISDPRRTPFNIGKGVELKDFNPGEAQVLAKRLDGDSVYKQQLFDRILYWTGGHPYPSQATLRAAPAAPKPISPATTPMAASGLVDNLVNKTFLSAQDSPNEKNPTVVS